LIFSVSDLICVTEGRPFGKHERELSTRRQKQRNRKRIIKCCGKNSCLPDEQRKANSSSKFNQVKGFTSSVCLVFIIIFYYFVFVPILFVIRKSTKQCILNAFDKLLGFLVPAVICLQQNGTKTSPSFFKQMDGKQQLNGKSTYPEGNKNRNLFLHH
jgi:hypothetical protein